MVLSSNRKSNKVEASPKQDDSSSTECESPPESAKQPKKATKKKQMGPVHPNANKDLETLMAEIQHTIVEPLPGKRRVYSMEQKELFKYLITERNMTVPAAAKCASVVTSTGHNWAKRLQTDPTWGTIPNKTGKKSSSRFQEHHKEYLLYFFEEFPGATIPDAVDCLTQQFEDFNLKKNSLASYIRSDYDLSMAKAGLRYFTTDSKKAFRKDDIYRIL